MQVINDIYLKYFCLIAKKKPGGSYPANPMNVIGKNETRCPIVLSLLERVSCNALHSGYDLERRGLISVRVFCETDVENLPERASEFVVGRWVGALAQAVAPVGGGEGDKAGSACAV